MANVDHLVAPNTCPLAGQPESKQTAVRIQRWDCDWQEVLLVRQPTGLPPLPPTLPCAISRRKHRRGGIASAGATARCKSHFTPPAARNGH